MQLLEKRNTHPLRQGDFRRNGCEKVSIIPLEVIVRNIAAGSFSKRFGVEEGTPLKQPSLEYSYKNDALGDPMINDYHIVALGLATKDELGTVSEYAFKINDILKSHFIKLNIQLVDFKLEFGPGRRIVLADEISRYLPFLGRQYRRKAGQGPFPQGFGRRVRSVPRGFPPFDRATPLIVKFFRFCQCLWQRKALIINV